MPADPPRKWGQGSGSRDGTWSPEEPVRVEQFGGGRRDRFTGAGLDPSGPFHVEHRDRPAEESGKGGDHLWKSAAAQYNCSSTECACSLRASSAACRPRTSLRTWLMISSNPTSSGILSTGNASRSADASMESGRSSR